MTSLSNSVKLYARFREAVTYQDFLDLVTMVALQDYGIVLGRSTTRTVSLQLASQVRQIDTLAIDSLYNRSGFTPLPHFHPNLYGLLLHADGAANAQIFRKTTSRTDVGHSRVQ